MLILYIRYQVMCSSKSWRLSASVSPSPKCSAVGWCHEEGGVRPVEDLRVQRAVAAPFSSTP